jgi:hypothetical protein
MAGSLHESGDFIAINGTADGLAPLTPRALLYKANPCGAQMPR